MAASRRLRTQPGRTASEAGIAALTRFAVAGAWGEPSALRRAALAARRAGATRRAIEETALMLVLYAGYPAALETLRALNRAWPGRPRNTQEGTIAEWQRRGATLCRRAYGAAYPRLLAAVRGLHPDLAIWMVEQGYGRVLARRGLGVGARERITVAVLASTGRRRQLVSHLLGAARVGVPTSAIRRALAVGLATRAAGVAARAAAQSARLAALPGRGTGRARRGPRQPGR